MISDKGDDDDSDGGDDADSDAAAATVADGGGMAKAAAVKMQRCCQLGKHRLNQVDILYHFVSITSRGSYFGVFPHHPHSLQCWHCASKQVESGCHLQTEEKDGKEIK